MSDFKSFNAGIIDEFRANGGKVGGMFEGAPMLLLTTTGAKSGNPYTTPVVHTNDGDRIVIIASKAGARQPSRLVPQHRRQPRGHRRARDRDVPGDRRRWRRVRSASASTTPRPS